MAERIAWFLTQAHQLDTNHDAIKTLCEAEMTWLYANNKSQLTVAKKVVPAYRKALREAGLVRGTYYREFNEPWLLYLSPDTEKIQTYTQDYNQRKATVVRGNQYTIPDPEGLVQYALSLLNSPTAYDIVAGLLLLTGRRESEIGVTGSFEPCADDQVHVIFRGQLKGGEEKLQRAITIPLLGDRTRVCEALNRVRHMTQWQQYTPRQFDDRVGSDLRKKIKRLFTPLFPDCALSLSPHALRKAYAAIADAWCDHPGWASNAYIAHIMGHEETDFSTVVSYQYFTV